MPRRNDSGFTLIELIMAVLIIGILASLLLPNYRRSMLKAQAADVTTKIEAINIAVKDYEADHGEPPNGPGPAGTAPAWLSGYAEDRIFQSSNGVTMQLVITSGASAPTLLVDAGSDPAMIQVLLATAGTLGNRAAVAGGGANLVVSLSN